MHYTPSSLSTETTLTRFTEGFMWHSQKTGATSLLLLCPPPAGMRALALMQAVEKKIHFLLLPIQMRDVNGGSLCARITPQAKG